MNGVLEADSYISPFFWKKEKKNHIFTCKKLFLPVPFIVSILRLIDPNETLIYSMEIVQKSWFGL